MGNREVGWIQLDYLEVSNETLTPLFWGLAEGTEALGEDTNDQAQADFQQKSLKAFSTIFLALSSSQLYLVTSCDSFKAAWDALRNHFERDTLANKLFLRKQYNGNERRNFS